MSRFSKPNRHKPSASSRLRAAPRTIQVSPATAEVVPLRPKPRAPEPGAPHGFADGLVVELAQAILRLAAENPNLIAQVRSALIGGGVPNHPGPFLMRKGDYADHAGYSVRTLDKLIAAGLPTRGHGKLLRIVVTDADDWLLAHDAENLDEVDLLAMRNATKRSGGSAHGG